VGAAKGTKLLDIQLLFGELLVARRRVIATFALLAR
jgi:hypothetical protein